MATINELIRERRRVFQNLKRGLKVVDTTLEEMERRIASVLTRKRKVPENQDLAYLADKTIEIDKELEDFLKILAQGFVN